jgi:transketolase
MLHPYTKRYRDSFDGNSGWRSFVDPQVPVIPIDPLCASAPGAPVMEHYEFGVDNICGRTRHLLLDPRRKS